MAINAKGQLLANTSTSSPVDYIPSFLAASLAPLTLDPLPGASQGAEALGLTEDPLVAGWSFTSGNAARHAVVWNTATPGSPADLGTLAGGTNSRALAVNDSGLVVGNSEVTGGDLHAFSCAFSAGACSGGLQDLGTLGGSSSFATGVNDSGEIVGSSTLSGGATHAFLYSGGTMYDLGTLGGTTSNAYAINAAGQVVGDSKDASGNTHAFLWTPDSPNGTTGTMLDLETLGGSFSHAYAINNLGQVVGDALTASSGYHVFLYSGGEMFDMQSAMPPGSPVLESGSGINDLGQIVASDSSYPVLLNPVGAIGAAAVNNSGFSPTSLSIAFGGTAEWSNVGSKSHNVSDAGAMNLFHSGALGPTAGYTFSFVGAGTYTYTDTTDGAKATVKVTMSRAPANGTASTLFQIYFAAGPPPTGFAYDVQVLHPGSKTWSNLKVGTTTPLLAFKPNAGTGKYEFRARIRKKSTGATSGWSPTEAISVT